MSKPDPMFRPVRDLRSPLSVQAVLSNQLHHNQDDIPGFEGVILTSFSATDEHKPRTYQLPSKLQHEDRKNLTRMT